MKPTQEDQLKEIPRNHADEPLQTTSDESQWEDLYGCRFWITGALKLLLLITLLGAFLYFLIKALT